MQSSFFLVIHCLKDDGMRAIPLSSPPDDEVNPIGIAQIDTPCIIHNAGLDIMADHQSSKRHNSVSIIVEISEGGEKGKLGELAIKTADKLLKGSRKERL